MVSIKKIKPIQRITSGSRDFAFLAATADDGCGFLFRFVLTNERKMCYTEKHDEV